MSDVIKNISDEDFYKLLKKKAKENDKVFQHWVGDCYLCGCNVEKNREEALKWFKLSAEQGYAPAQNNLGFMYEKGLGVTENKEEALKYYKLAAEQRFAAAQYNLAVLWRNGSGVERNFKIALGLFELSANQDYRKAFCGLGEMYYKGLGVEVDLPKAKEYYEKALAKADVEDTYWNKATELDKKIMEGILNKIKEELEKIKEKDTIASQTERNDVFICYTHKDGTYCKEMREFLKLLETITKNEIKYWDDSKIKSGDEWRQKINAALSKAKVAVLLVSINFFTSDYVQREELPKILESADKDGTTILLIPIATCPYQDTDIEKYQFVSDPKIPLKRMNEDNRNEVYTKLYERIKEIYNFSLKKK